MQSARKQDVPAQPWSADPGMQPFNYHAVNATETLDELTRRLREIAHNKEAENRMKEHHRNATTHRQHPHYSSYRRSESEFSHASSARNGSTSASSQDQWRPESELPAPTDSWRSESSFGDGSVHTHSSSSKRGGAAHHGQIMPAKNDDFARPSTSKSTSSEYSGSGSCSTNTKRAENERGTMTSGTGDHFSAPTASISKPKATLTSVAYRFKDEDSVYLVKFPEGDVTLRMVKDKSPKRGSYRFFVKTENEDFGGMSVMEEIIDDDAILPLASNGKIVVDVVKDS